MQKPRRNTLNAGRTGAMLLVALAVLVGTGTVGFLPDPEARVTTSADGAVRIEGSWRADVPPPAILRRSLPGPLLAVRGAPYEISAPLAPEGSLYRVSFNIGSSLGERPVLYQFDADLAAWRALPAEQSADQWRLQIETQALSAGLWGMGISLPVDRPAGAEGALRDALRVWPPGAVGYQAFAMRVNAAGDAVLLADPVDTGGCDGLFHLGNTQTKTSRDVPFGDDAYRIVVRWQMADGCSPGVPITSARTAH